MMYRNKFSILRDTQKGYQATYTDFFEYSITAGSEDRSDRNVRFLDDYNFISK